MGGACWITPRNCASVSGKFHVFATSDMSPRCHAHPRYRTYLSCTRANMSCDTPIKVIKLCVNKPPMQYSPLSQRTATPRIPTKSHRPRNAIYERIQRVSLSNLHIVSHRPLFSGAFLKFLRRQRDESYNLQISLFNCWCMDGFIAPKRPDCGNEAEVLGIVARHGSTVSYSKQGAENAVAGRSRE